MLTISITFITDRTWNSGIHKSSRSDSLADGATDGVGPSLLFYSTGYTACYAQFTSWVCASSGLCHWWSGPLVPRATRGNRTQKRLKLEEIEKTIGYTTRGKLGWWQYFSSTGGWARGFKYSDLAPYKFIVTKPYTFIVFGAWLSPNPTNS